MKNKLKPSQEIQNLQYELERLGRQIYSLTVGGKCSTLTEMVTKTHHRVIVWHPLAVIKNPNLTQ